MDGLPELRIPAGRLGRCPACGDDLPVDAAAVRYRPADGWPLVVAECPSCRAVVNPR